MAESTKRRRPSGVIAMSEKPADPSPPPPTETTTSNLGFYLLESDERAQIGSVVRAPRSDKAVLQTEERVVYAGHLLRGNSAAVKRASATGEDESNDRLVWLFPCRGLLRKKADEQGGHGGSILHTHAILNPAGWSSGSRRPRSGCVLRLICVLVGEKISMTRFDP